MSNRRTRRSGQSTSITQSATTISSELTANAEGPVSDPKKAALIAGLTMTRSKVTLGPLPAAEELESYGRVLPGLDQKIVQWAEDEGKHRREMQKLELGFARDAMASDVGTQRLVVWLLFAISLIFACLMGYALYLNSAPAAIAAVVGAIAPIVGAFSIRRKSQKEAE